MNIGDRVRSPNGRGVIVDIGTMIGHCLVEHDDWTDGHVGAYFRSNNHQLKPNSGWYYSFSELQLIESHSSEIEVEINDLVISSCNDVVFKDLNPDDDYILRVDKYQGEGRSENKPKRRWGQR